MNAGIMPAAAARFNQAIAFEVRRARLILSYFVLGGDSSPAFRLANRIAKPSTSKELLPGRHASA